MVFVHLFLSFCILIIPIIFKVRPPMKINSYYGYRTPLSMRNEKNWKIGNRLYGNYLCYLSIITIVVQYTCFFLFDKLWALWIASGTWIFVLFFSIYLTEKHLRNQWTIFIRVIPDKFGQEWVWGSIVQDHKTSASKF